MSGEQFEQPGNSEETKVTGFSLTSTSLQLTVTRPGADPYQRRNPPPVPTDIPPDYLSAITAWIARGLR